MSTSPDLKDVQKSHIDILNTLNQQINGGDKIQWLFLIDFAYVTYIFQTFYFRRKQVNEIFENSEGDQNRVTVLQ